MKLHYLSDLIFLKSQVFGCTVKTEPFSLVICGTQLFFSRLLLRGSKDFLAFLRHSVIYKYKYTVEEIEGVRLNKAIYFFTVQKTCAVKVLLLFTFSSSSSSCLADTGVYVLLFA